MKATARIASLALVGLALLALAWPERGPPPEDQPGAMVRGVSLGLFASDPAYDYGDMLGELRGRGATDVLLVVNWTQRDLHAHDIEPWQGWSPSAQTLDRTLGQARALGLRVGLMPVVRLRHRPEGAWRGQIDPSAGAEAWFEAYRPFVLSMARAAQRHQAQRLVIGSELCSMEAHEGHWRRLIEEVRGLYQGRLLYSANWDHFEEVPFWDALDEVGLTAYFPLAARLGEPSPQALARAWEAPHEALRRLRARVGKPVLITEVGYANHPEAATRPWETSSALPPEASRDLALQASLYEAFCASLQPSPSVDGFYFWNWFGHGGPRDRGFTPRGKPAAAAMSACLRRSAALAPPRAPTTSPEAVVASARRPRP